MIYEEFKGEKISKLGYGTMRLPVINGKDSDIDVEKTKALIAHAMESGINYYDTAWGYHDGNSETVIGDILKEYPRESFFLTTKFPGYDRKNMGHAKEIFEKQLEKLHTDYFDFYLVHNLCELNIDDYLNEELGDVNYLIKMKKEGKIRHLGVSVHSSFETLKRFMEKYGEEMEFCQLQLNWFDYKFQRADLKIELLKEYGIPVWVMEPLRGGKLCNLLPEYRKEIDKVTKKTNVELGFGFLNTLPEVKVILSGMTEMDQLKDNLRLFEEKTKNTDEENRVLESIKDKMLSKGAVPCTACHYCVSHCPKGLDIPYLLDMYNEKQMNKDSFIVPMGIASLPKDKRPSACIGCGSCVKVCPQGIKVPDYLQNFKK